MGSIKSASFVIIVAASSVLSASCRQMGSTRSPVDHGISSSTDCQMAISLGEAMLATLSNPSDYKLIRVENLYLPGRGYLGPHVWHLTFKARELIPEGDNGLVGLGGEVFIEVDMNTKKAKLLGYGE